MTSMQRVLTTLGHQEPDRVPLLLLLSLHGAKELGISIREYFSQPDFIVEGQLRLRKKFGHDCLYAFSYGPIEYEAWGGEAIFVEDGPPNSGRPVFTRPEQIAALQPPKIRDCPGLVRGLKTTEMLKARVGDEAPVLGVVMSPFSLPVMQMGFDHYFDLIYEHPAAFDRLMALNEAFCVDWANALLEAGATAIAYFDPVSSTTIIPPALYEKTGFAVAQRTLARIQGPTITAFASGRCLPIIDRVAQTGTIGIGVSVEEDLAQIKAACRGRLAVIGNLNAIEMRRWTPREAEEKVKEAIAKAAPGGGFLLADNHGEIPFQVTDDVLFAIVEAVKRWGNYPVDWVETHEE